MNRIQREVENFINRVVSGTITAPKLVIQSYERHLNDLKTGHKRGLYFDPIAATKIIIFFEGIVKHTKAEWKGKKVRLEPWQKAHFWVLFGWMKADGTRRFREALVYIPRKNGKTLMGSGVANYMFVGDGELGPEIYCAANSSAQAQIAFDQSKEMVKQSERLTGIVDLYRYSMADPDNFAFFRPVSGDADNQDGFNAHFVLYDEIHKAKDRKLYDVLLESMSARMQPMAYIISTVGDNIGGLAYEMYQFAKSVLGGLVEDDSFYALIYEADEGDDWKSEDTWRKANPNYGISKKPDFMEAKAKRAAALPTALSSFKIKDLNIWQKGKLNWLDAREWAKCDYMDPDLFGDVEGLSYPELLRVQRKGLQGRPCYAGLDLSSNTDTTSLVLVFPPDELDGTYYWLPWFWIPEDNMTDRKDRDRVDYPLWDDWGVIESTPGNVIDTDYILETLKGLMSLYKIEGLAYDRWGSIAIAPQMQQIAPHDKWLVKFGQGSKSMSPPTKALEQLYLKKRVSHMGNPVLKWMGGNVMAVMNAAGDIKPDKVSSRSRIDGIVSGIMGLSGAMTAERKADSVYKSRGIRVI